MDREKMAREKDDIPPEERERERRAEEAQEELDDIPPPGTDPLHEGP